MLIAPETIAVFFAASFLFGLTPGPDNLFVLTQSMAFGRGAGLIVTTGLCTGLVVHTTAASLGAAAVLRASPEAFAVLKVLGTAYLLYIAWSVFRSASGAAALPAQNPLTQRKLYAAGVIMNVTNPKVLIFFLAFLPQFTEPPRGSVALQMMVLGAVFIVATLIVFGGIAVAGGTVGAWLRTSPRRQLALKRMAGAVIAGLALTLLLSDG